MGSPLSDDRVYITAGDLLEEVTKLLSYVSEKEPDRFRRKGFQALLERALDLEEALDDVALPDPTENTDGIVGRDHPDTSKQAALNVMPRTGTQRLAVLEAVANGRDGGMTDEEIRDELGLRYSSECARRKELVDGGWLEDSGRTRPTSTGQEAIVWVVTQRALREMPILDDVGNHR